MNKKVHGLTLTVIVLLALCSVSAGIYIAQHVQNKNKLIASEAHNNIQVYPNPASQFVIISYESQTNGYFRIFNSIGELILETELAAYNTKTQIPLPNLANGIYQYEVGFANKIKTMGKLSILK